jgi:hypothetical protein
MVLRGCSFSLALLGRGGSVKYWICGLAGFWRWIEEEQTTAKTGGACLRQSGSAFGAAIFWQA